MNNFFMIVSLIFILYICLRTLRYRLQLNKIQFGFLVKNFLLLGLDNLCLIPKGTKALYFF